MVVYCLDTRIFREKYLHLFPFSARGVSISHMTKHHCEEHDLVGYCLKNKTDANPDISGGD